MAGENVASTSEFPSCSPLQMYPTNPRLGSGQSGRRMLLRDAADVMNTNQLCHQPLRSVEYEATSPDADNDPQTSMTSTLSSRRHSAFSLHSSSSSGDSRPSSSLRKKIKNNSDNRPSTGDNHLPGTNRWKMASPRENLQHRQNSYYEDSGEELSPRQLSSKCSLSKYKPLPAIKGKSHRTPSPDILRIPTVSHIEDTVMYTEKKISPHNTGKPAMGLKRESSMLWDLNHPKQSTNHLANTHLVQKASSPNPVEPYGNYEELPPQTCPPNSTSWPELPDLNNFPDEPGPEEARTLLAIKLPNGQRIHRFFRLKDPLWLVRRFAEVSSSNDFSNFHLVKSIPREILDLDRTIEENHLLEKILLHLERFTHDGNLKSPNSS